MALNNMIRTMTTGLCVVLRVEDGEDKRSGNKDMGWVKTKNIEGKNGWRLKLGEKA